MVFMLYGVKIKNKSGKVFYDKILFFDRKEKAVQFERDIRFLDDVAYREDYKKKALSIYSKYSSFFVEDMGDMDIELINQYPINVEFFD